MEKKSYEERRESVRALFERLELSIVDENDERWIRCTKCGCIETTDKFTYYGGSGADRNYGSCRACSAKYTVEFNQNVKKADDRLSEIQKQKAIAEEKLKLEYIEIGKHIAYSEMGLE